MPGLKAASFPIQLRDLFKLLDRHSDEEIKDAIVSENFSSRLNLPTKIGRLIAIYPNIWTDIGWYISIRKSLHVDNFPCVHIAYATSAKANRSIVEEHGVFSILTGNKRSEKLVIAFCPWCAIGLNTDASQRLKHPKSE
ncbi:hypothetical protein [Rhizobium sp. PP-CC-3G-465]|uniref:hypothetical protein n=1 Tax=Rhizobium sp. PP-CC-3G-465 TaxID=2135648 RepID=UPI00104D68F5